MQPTNNPSLARPRDGFSVLCFGAPGSGKTSVAVRIAIREVLRGRKCLVYDPTGDCEKRFRGESVSGDRVSPDLMGGVALHARDILRNTEPTLTERLNGKTGRRVVFLPRANHEYAKQSLHWFAGLEASRGWVLLVDECEEVWDTRLPRDAALRTIKHVRNMGHMLIACGQRPQATSTILRSNADHVLVFHSDSRAFVEKGLAEFGGGERFEKTYSLPRHAYVYRPPWLDDARAPLATHDGARGPIPW